MYTGNWASNLRFTSMQVHDKRLKTGKVTAEWVDERRGHDTQRCVLVFLNYSIQSPTETETNKK